VLNNSGSCWRLHTEERMTRRHDTCWFSSAFDDTQTFCDAGPK